MKYSNADFPRILKVIGEAARSKKTISIYYPKTENNKKGWREIEPYSFATDIGKDGEHVFYGKEIITPGHIFNAYTVGSNDDHCDSFILGKIEKIKTTNNSFIPRWKVEI